MSERIWVKPGGEDRLVIMPDGKRVPPEGLRVIMSPFVQRRFDQGDLVPMDEPKPEPSAPAPAPAPAKTKEA